MTQKTKPKTSPKLPTPALETCDWIDPRKKLLCRVAGNVAGALLGSPSPSLSSAEKIAEAAVDIAAAILKRAGVEDAS